ncbi:hypothetical protein [Kordia sp.]|uniref:hypothetical protein n=1 Tax=Kordia sp. TaxID=1965332 RepID=UPI003D6AC1B7
MREKKKPLRLRKYVVANLRAYTLKGGTASFPCVPTGPNPSDTCPTHEHTCPVTCDPETTDTYKITSPKNPCNPENGGGFQTGPVCP